jgi:1-acyl-sn-glycerol-3-phosphate acyltransferase
VSSRGRGLGGRPLSTDSPLVGGAGTVAPEPEHAIATTQDAPEAGAEELRRPQRQFDPRRDHLAQPPERREAPQGHLPDLRALLPASDEERSLDDWGRSESFFSLIEPALNFYYRYWFRVETEGIENVPSDGGALLVSNHSGALPPDAPMIMQAIRNEHPTPRPLYMLGEHWFKGYPGVGMLTNKIGLVAAHRANAQRLLYDEGRLAIVFPEGQKGSRKVYWQRYRLRRFGRGGFVRTAIRARVPIVPIALIGGEEAMPIFAHMRLMQRLTGLIYFPLNHAFPHFGLAAGAMYMPAKFKIRFLEPIDMTDYPPETADDPAEIQAIAERIRTRIQLELDDMLGARRSVWFG